VTALSLAGLVLLLATAVALAATGDLTQPAGTAGCLSDTTASGCAQGHQLLGTRSVAVSPDGKNVYVASQSTVARIDRDTATGALTQPAGAAGCISENGVGGCAAGHGIKFHIQELAVSPDGKNVYVTSSGSNAVARLDRDTTTGALTQPAGAAGCVSLTGAGPCADGHGLRSPHSVAVSPDGESVYVTSATGGGAVARFNRVPTTGWIAQPAGTAGCVSETGEGPCANRHGISDASSVAVSPDANSVYVAATGNFGAVARFNRNTTSGALTQPAGAPGCVSEIGTGPCADGHGLVDANGVVVSPDAKSVYVTSRGGQGAVARFNRDATTGEITQPAGFAGCISQGEGFGGESCVDGHGLDGAHSVAISPDSKTLYIASSDNNAVARINRVTTTGAIFQPAGAAGCVSTMGGLGCALGEALLDASDVAVSPDGMSVYVTSQSDNGAVAHFIRSP
jgi:DNA-binding beta-propeller fold protein YncE